MIKEFIGWIVAAIAFAALIVMMGFTAGATYGLLKSAFEIGALIWH